MLVRRFITPLGLGLVLSVAAAACTSGNVGGKGGDDDNGGSGGTAGKGSGGKGGGSGGSSGANGGNTSPGTDPGTKALHRLGKVEYNNTVRDLLGTSLRPADEFGFLDVAGYGFGNNANSLELTDKQLREFAGAAEKLANEVVSNASLKAKIFTCDVASGDACVKTILKNLAKRAYRRPVQDSEVDALMKLVALAKEKGDTVDVGVGLAIEAMLTSPNFLFRIELDPDPASNKPHPVSSYEMASRLSYFLWATMPDADLFAAADGDKLKSIDEVKAQATRMLKDGRSAALVDSFGGYWTMNNDFVDHEVDATTFPKFDQPLRQAMLGETQNMLKDVFSGAIGFNQFMFGDYTYVNDALATHYGLPKPGSATLTKTKLPDGSKRGSFLTNGSFLAATSQSTLTSVVKRGKYVLFKMMCGEVGNPLQDVPALTMSAGKTVREQFAAHEAQPVCAGCHKHLDPPGFVLEQYDAVGAFRTQDRGNDIDVKVDLRMGDEVKTVNNAVEMAKAISTSDGYAQCVSKSFLAYSMGRGPDRSDGAGDMDEKLMADFQSQLKSSGWKFPDLVNALVASDVFRMRRANEGVQQ